MNEALAVQPQGGSPSNMYQYTMVQLCAKFSAFIKI